MGEISAVLLGNFRVSLCDNFVRSCIVSCSYAKTWEKIWLWQSSLSQILSSIVTLISFPIAFTDLNLSWIKGALAFVCFSFFFFSFSFWLRELDKAEYSAFELTLSSPIILYRCCKYSLFFVPFTHLLMASWPVSTNNRVKYLCLLIQVQYCRYADL